VSAPAGPKALAFAAFGARGTGKTAWVRQLLQQLNPARLIVWDYKHDPSLRDVGTPYTDLASLILAMKAPRFQLRYLVDHDLDVHQQFEIFCRAAYQAGNLAMFVDELPEVTAANRAPPAWKKCVNVGRDYVVNGERKALTIIGAGQRPAECDKTFIANCDVIHSGRLGDVAEARKWARSWGCDPHYLANMPDLSWIERRADQAQVLHGQLSFSNSKRPAAAREVKKPLPKTRAPKGAHRAGRLRAAGS
jgi:hypothetical protein